MNTVAEGGADPIGALAMLSSNEIVSGIVCFSPRAFSDQQLLRLFESLQHQYPDAFGRFDVHATASGLHSEAARGVLDGLEMAKIVDVSMPNPVEQYYRPRIDQAAYRKRSLESRGVLPEHETAFRALVEKLLQSQLEAR